MCFPKYSSNDAMDESNECALHSGGVWYPLSISWNGHALGLCYSDGDRRISNPPIGKKNLQSANHPTHHTQNQQYMSRMSQSNHSKYSYEGSYLWHACGAPISDMLFNDFAYMRPNPCNPISCEQKNWCHTSYIQQIKVLS